MQVLDTVDLDAIRALHQREEFFWLDLVSPSDADLDALGAILEIPDLAIEDTKEFGQRPKIDEYADRVLIVFYGAHETELVEVHVHVSGQRGRDRPARGVRPPVGGPRARGQGEDPHRAGPRLPRARCARRLAAHARRPLHAEVERLEEVAFARPKPADRRRMSQVRSELFRLQQIVAPQRDMLARGGDLLENLPGLERDVARHPFRDVHDDLVVTANEIDYLRELLSETVNVLINAMAGRLTIIATIFLPLTFATGFFGMNFGWMVRHINSAESFLILGVGGMILPLIVAAVLLLRSGYLRAPVGFRPPLNAGVQQSEQDWERKRKMAVDLTQVANIDAPPGELPDTMAAWVIRQEREGEPVDAFQVEEIEVPEPGAFEVIVRVMAAGVNFNNVWAALGKPVSVFRYHPDEDHHIGGSDASGVVWKVGPGVTRWKPGDEVVMHCNQASYEDPEVHGLDPLAAPSQQIWGYETSWGSFAQFTKVQAQQLLPKPAHLAWEEAASYGLTYFTAYRMLMDRAQLQAGHRVLIWGAAGGLGVFATQLCARRRRRLRRRRLLRRRRARSSSSSAPRASSTATSSPA